MMLLWRIWYVRNEIIHAKPAPPVEVSCRFLASYLESLQSISIDPNVKMHIGKTPVSTCYPLMVDTCNNDTPFGNPWSPPPAGHDKLNTDGSVVNGIAEAGMILKAHDGSIIFSSCRHLFYCDDVLETEMLAIKEGLMLASQWSNLPIQVESDCLEAIKMVQSAVTNRSKFAFLVKEIKDNLEERGSCITHIRRSQNLASHFMANFGRV